MNSSSTDCALSQDSNSPLIDIVPPVVDIIPTNIQEEASDEDISSDDIDHSSVIPLLYRAESSCRCRCHRFCLHDLHQSSDAEQDKDESLELDWCWDSVNKSDSSEVSNTGRDVTFHRRFSNGTAAVRGDTALTDDQHYWEIKMTTSIYGTDIMVGCGTANVDLEEYSNRFVSMLGQNSESWGLSYSGMLVHDKSRRSLCKTFGQGVTIGIHLDMWLGKMSFFRNGKFIGVGFNSGLRGKEIYPMACSTAARTGMKIVRSTSFPTSLQFMCCQVLRQCVPFDQHVTQAVRLAPGLRLFLLNNLDWLLRPYSPATVSHAVCGIRKRVAATVHHVNDVATEEGEDEGSDAQTCKLKRLKRDPDCNSSAG